jgi:hypothetical protein
MIEALVRISTPSGVRLEYINDWCSADESAVLNLENAFSMCTVDNVHIRVAGWGSDRFRVEQGSAASMLCPVVVSNIQYDASDEEEEEEGAPLLAPRKRKRRPASVADATMLDVTPEKKQRKCMNSCLLPEQPTPRDTLPPCVQFFMPDSAADSVWIIPFSTDRARRMIIEPYCFRQFGIENSCGSVTGLFDVNFREISAIAAGMYDAAAQKKKRKRGARACTIISMLGGTLTLCPERYQIDFRGARGLRLLRSDLEGLIGQAVAADSVVSYMMVLKGCLGVPVVTTSTACYIATRMAPW